MKTEIKKSEYFKNLIFTHKEIRLLLRGYNTLLNNGVFNDITYLINEWKNEQDQLTSELIENHYFRNISFIYCLDSYISESTAFRKLKEFTSYVIFRLSLDKRKSKRAKKAIFYLQQQRKMVELKAELI